MRLLGNLSDPFVLSWNVGSLVTVLLPLFIFMIARLTNQEEWNYNQNQQQQGDANYNDNPYANPDNYDEYGNYVGPTHWWQFWKSSNNGGDGENGDRNEMRAPWWYVWGEEREGRDPEDAGKGSVLFVYVWLLVSMAALIYLGNTHANNIGKLEGLRWALFGFANMCLVTMVLLVGLEAIEVEGRELEEDGFYGQTPVLLFLTCFFGITQSIVFIGWTAKRLSAQQAPSDKTEGFVSINYERSPSSGFL
ncbi:hypothetical protein IV203_031233 [Nitzschia inconspicua]|uniref:Uncharacterized protein n=1 Tax=Nitzschia inconspicua TaxID=303405 RepID=A0A9K3LV96_9STRA|nr:hypothetical protein IV203_031233 [Nitzschia inconspicua]